MKKSPSSERQREAAIKVLLLMAVEIYFGTLEKKGSKKNYFFLNGSDLYNPPPLLMNRPLREDFFCGFPEYQYNFFKTFSFFPLTPL